VLEATNLVELIGRHVRLTRRGKDYVGLCPFHTEKTPSFKVSPSHQYFYCFGCKASGNALDFVMRRDRIEYRDALRLLAEAANVALPRSGRDKGDAGQRQLLLEAQSAACGVFENLLRDDRAGGAAREYLTQRGFSEQSLKDFRIGLAPAGWDGLLKHPAMRKFAPELLAAAGLVRPRQGEAGYYDTFRERLIFPIRDESGRVIAFGGRVMPGSTDPAKYLNSPDTPLFTKGRCVFGLDRARQAIVETRTVAVVEGYTDVVMAHQFGATNVVSVLGTAMTPEHVAALRRFADRIVLLFDADAAGEAAMTRIVELFLTQPIEIAIATLPVGLDPDELLLKEGADGFNRLIAAAEDALGFQWRRLASEIDSKADVTGQQKAVERYLNLLAGARGSGPVDDLRWAAALTRVARLTEVPIETLHRRFGGAGRSPGRRKSAARSSGAGRQRQRVDAAGAVPSSVAASAGGAQSAEASAGQPLQARIRAEREIIGLLLMEPLCWQEVQSRMAPANFADQGCRALAELYWEQQRDVGHVSLSQFLGALGDRSAGIGPIYGSSTKEEGFDRNNDTANDLQVAGAGTDSSPQDSLGELAVNLVEFAESALGLGPVEGRAGSEPARKKIEQRLRLVIEDITWMGREREKQQMVQQLKSGKATSDADEVEMLRRLQEGVRQGSQRYKNI
jgi:DNA primase